MFRTRGAQRGAVKVGCCILIMASASRRSSLQLARLLWAQRGAASLESGTRLLRWQETSHRAFSSSATWRRGELFDPTSPFAVRSTPANTIIRYFGAQLGAPQAYNSRAWHVCHVPVI